MTNSILSVVTPATEITSWRDHRRHDHDDPVHLDDRQNGLFTTATNLKAQWQGYYDQMVSGKRGDTDLRSAAEGQRPGSVSEHQAQRSGCQNPDRQDIRRDDHARYERMRPLTASDYLSLERTLQSSSAQAGAVRSDIARDETIGCTLRDAEII